MSKVQTIPANQIARTKIITTIGPASTSAESIKQFYLAGMRTMRLNFSHGSHQEHKQRIEWARTVSEELKRPISVMLDTKGPEIRIGQMKDGKQTLQAGTMIKIYGSKEAYGHKINDHTSLTMSHNIAADVSPGVKILLDDGKCILETISIKQDIVTAKVFNTYQVLTNKRVNIPGVVLSLPFLSDKDKADIIFGIENHVDYIAASFVSFAKDIHAIRQLLTAHKAEHIQIIAKIESQCGIENLEEIIDASDGIMVARGDLGLEIPYYDVPYWEKVIIQRCGKQNKMVIVATQMLDSMTNNPFPTRAEVTDVYFATAMGADATMLSGESANGQYPLLAIETMNNINLRAENEFYSFLEYKKHLATVQASIFGPRAEVATRLAEKTKSGKYEYALVISNTGQLLKTISTFRPNVKIIGVTEKEYEYRAYGAWHTIFMNLVDNVDLYKRDHQAVSDLLKSWNAPVGSTVLLAHRDFLKKIIIK